MSRAFAIAHRYDNRALSRFFASLCCEPPTRLDVYFRPRMRILDARRRTSSAVGFFTSASAELWAAARARLFFCVRVNGGGRESERRRNILHHSFQLVYRNLRVYTHKIFSPKNRRLNVCRRRSSIDTTAARAQAGRPSHNGDFERRRWPRQRQYARRLRQSFRSLPPYKPKIVALSDKFDRPLAYAFRLPARRAHFAVFNYTSKQRREFPAT